MTCPLVRSIIGLLCVLLLLPSISLGSTPTVGEQAPPFMYSDLNAGGVSPFETFERNRPIVLTFLQTACRSCHREMLALKRLKVELEGFGVMAVFIDMTVRNVKKYVEENELPFVCTWDSSGEIAETYGVSFSPTSFLLDAERKVVNVYRGFHPGVERTMKSDLEGLLAR
ncbi:MAG: redoxin domain-containing protein [Deferrisomatales bacterium]|nr:redoxin domain-containing protein [Deferrisomatales bacterium]